MDISAFTKVEVSGPDAEAFIDRLVPNRVPAKVGRVALTHLLGENGRIELETTLVRLAADRFYLVCAAFFEQRLVDHLSFARADADITITNRSSSWGAMALNGPRARDILGACTSADLSIAAFPWLSAQQIDIAGSRLWAIRMSYAGELGWEMHGEPAAILAAYQSLWQAGKAHGLVNYGSFAMNAMRMEKAYKGAGELTNEVTLPEADVMRFVRLDKEFRGKAATVAAAGRPLKWVCVYLEVADDGRSDGHGGEAVLSGGERVGAVSSIAFGHAVGKLLAFAYVSADHAAPGTALQVVVMGEPRDARVLADAAYDPQGLLPRSDVERVAVA